MNEQGDKSYLLVCRCVVCTRCKLHFKHIVFEKLFPIIHIYW